ncbi:MAG: hypothetical protein LDL44_00255 [Caenispirillum sp.]|nr:hypothetical protein [Caenispirillum sp.]
MSVVNFNLQPDRILVLTDTVAYARQAPALLGKKVHHNHVSRAAITTRGPVRVGDFVGELVEQATLPSMAVGGAVVTMALRKAFGLFPEARKNRSEATLFMWDGEPRVIRWRMDEAGEVEQFEYGAGYYMTPSLGIHEYPPILQPKQMVSLALVQQRIVKTHGLLMCVGGDMQLTTITADGVTFETIGSYPDKAETEAAVASYQAQFMTAELAA